MVSQSRGGIRDWLLSPGALGGLLFCSAIYFVSPLVLDHRLSAHPFYLYSCYQFVNTLDFDSWDQNLDRYLRQ
jgi:hypothetical protein